MSYSYYYFDTDAFIKLLVPEVGHQICQEIYSDPYNVIISSNMTIVEVYSALVQCKNSTAISQAIFGNAVRYFNSLLVGVVEDRENKATVNIIEVTPDQMNIAKDLVLNSMSLHPGDAIQLAVAFDYKGIGFTMVSGDKRVLRISNENGIDTINVNQCMCVYCHSSYEFKRVKDECAHCRSIMITIDKAVCPVCGNECKQCSNDKWCEMIRRTIAV